MSEYLLSKHVHLRLTGEGAIFLDLRRDEYLTLSQEQVAALCGIVRGWPITSTLGGTAISNDSDRVSEFIATLLQKGLVTTDTISGKPAVQVEIDPAEASLVEQDSTMTTCQFGYAASFLRAYLRASLALRLRPLNKVISTIEHRKQAHACSSQPTGVHKLQELMRNFLLLRPFVYTQKERCLLDSLSLVHFLATYGVFPSLVFGVRIRPFEAHAWVQAGRYSLNYPAEYVRAFSPIMTV